MGTTTETRITSTQAKDAIYKASQISSSASEIDNDIRHIENRASINNFISNKAINILGDSISVDYRSYGNSIKMAFNYLFGSKNFGFPYEGYGFESDELSSNEVKYSLAPNSLLGRFLIINPSSTVDMNEYAPAYQYFKNSEKVRIFYDDLQTLGTTFDLKFYRVDGTLLQTNSFTTDASGKTYFVTAPIGATKMSITNTSLNILKVENPQIVKNEDDYTTNVLGTAGRALSYISYSVLDKWFDNAEYAILGLNTNDTQNNTAFEEKIAYIESKFNNSSNLYTKLVIIDLSADKDIHYQVIDRLKQMHINCEGSYFISIRDIYNTEDVDRMITLGLINTDRVHPTVPFGQTELSNGILKKMSIDASYKFLWQYNKDNNEYNKNIAGIDINRGGNSLDSNIAIGKNSGFYFTTAKENVSIGYESSLLSTTPSKNTIIGYKAGRSNTTGFSNSFFGCESGHSSTGSGHTLIGSRAGYSLNAGNYNTFIGEQSGNLMQDGSANASTSNSTCIGRDSRVSGSNQVQLGSSSTTTYAYGAVQDRSDIRDKADIENTPLGLDFICKVNPVQYRWDYRDDYILIDEETGEVTTLEKDGSKKRSRLHQGVIAQQVKEVIDELGVDFGGYQDHSLNGGCDVKSIGYQEFIPPLIKAIQELKAEIEILKSKA